MKRWEPPIRIALVTPWPPDQSGIADFARDLAIGLAAAGHTVDVFSSGEAAEAVAGVTVVRVPPAWDGSELASYSHRLYQLGNHADYHAWMLTAMTRQPGVVQLHDFVLHHLLIGLTNEVDRWPDYLRAVREWYGDDVAERAELALLGKAQPLWEAAEVVDVPFFEFFVSHAAAVIAHSRFAATRIVQRLPRLPMRQVAQTYRDQPLRCRTSLVRIGIFGGVQDNKKIDWIVEAFELLGAAMRPLEVTVVGTVTERGTALVTRAQSMDHLTIRFVGRVDTAQFQAELANTDLCISLRHPTMGETSAIVMRALQHGVPTIVSDTGWYAELPDAVKKVPLQGAAFSLASLLAGLLKDPESYVAWAKDCAALPHTLGLSHDRTVDDIVDFLQSYRAERATSDLVAARLVDLGFIGDSSEKAVLGRLSQLSVIDSGRGLVLS